MRSIEFEIIDLRSLDEVASLQRSLLASRGVSEATANLTVSVTVRYDPNQISPAELEAAILDCREHCKGNFAIGHICGQSSKDAP